MYTSTLSSTLVLDEMGGQCHAPATLPPERTCYPLYRLLGGSQGRSGGVRKVSPLTRIRSQDCLTRSKSLHRLHYIDPQMVTDALEWLSQFSGQCRKCRLTEGRSNKLHDTVVTNSSRYSVTSRKTPDVKNVITRSFKTK